MLVHSSHHFPCCSALLAEQMVPASSSLLWQTVRSWAQPCCPCPELCSSPGTTGKQVDAAGPARSASPQNRSSPETTSPQFFPFFLSFHCSAMHFTFLNNYCPSKPAPLVLLWAEAQNDRGDTQLLSSAAVCGQTADGCGIWRLPAESL